MRADSFSTVEMQISFDHSASIASTILGGSSSLDVDADGPCEDGTGILKTRPGEVGGLVGGDATALA